MHFIGFRIRKRFLSILVFPLIIVLIYFVFVEEKDVKQTFRKALKPKAEFKINGFKLFESLQDGKDWNLRASVAEIFREKEMAYMKDLQLTFYSSDGRIFSLNSDKGQLNLKTRETYLSENVKATADNGYFVTTNGAHFFPNSQTLSSKEAIKVEGPDIILTGKGFQGDLVKKTFDILHDVKTIIKHHQETQFLQNTSSKQDMPLTITSKSCHFDTNKNIAVYSKTVTGQGRGFTINADKITISYKLENKMRTIKHILALGNVRIKKGNRYSKSQKAFLETKTQNITLTGSPSITEERNTVNGDKIVYNYSTQKFYVISAKGHYKTN